jgi:hypothetical protein
MSASDGPRQAPPPNTGVPAHAATSIAAPIVVITAIARMVFLFNGYRLT